MRFSDKIIILSFVLVILFTVAVLFVFLKTGSEPSTLVGCFFGCLTGEMGLLASIKHKKIAKGANKGNDSSEQI